MYLRYRYIYILNIMADLTELYGPENLTIKPKQNKYNNIIDNIIEKNQSRNKYMNNSTLNEPQPFGMNSYTSYASPQNFTNEVSFTNENILKQIETQVKNKYDALKSTNNVQPNNTTLPFTEFRNETQPKIMTTQKQLPTNSISSDKKPIVEKMTNVSSSDCDSAMKHIMSCPTCMKKLEAMFSTKKSSFESDMLDVVIYSLTGFFVLFILHSFINLGKFLVK